MKRLRAIALLALAAALSAGGCDRTEAPPAPATQPQAGEAAPPTDMAELKLELPAPRFAGTPRNVPAGTKMNLRPPGVKVPPLLVPPGVTNLAAGRPVTSSDSEPVIGELAMVTDGDKEAGSGHFVEIGPGQQWVQIDLGEQAEVFALAVWHEHEGPRVYRDVVVQVSADPDLIDYVTVFNNDWDNSLGQGKGKDFEYFETFTGKLMPAMGGGTPAKGRYVRLWSNASAADPDPMSRYTEVEVWGRAKE